MKFLMILSALLILTGCATNNIPTTTEVVTETRIVRQNVPVLDRPRGVSLLDIDWSVVTEDNLEEFLIDLEERTGFRVFTALTIEDYENLSLNIQELRRYILEQQGLIEFYENSLTE